MPLIAYIGTVALYVGAFMLFSALCLWAAACVTRGRLVNPWA
jgi:hypothetical protein